MECLLPSLCMVTIPHIMVGLERMLDYRSACWISEVSLYIVLLHYYTVIQCFLEKRAAVGYYSIQQIEGSRIQYSQVL